MRCKACDAMLGKTGDDTYCRKCIVASEDVDMYNDSLFRDNYSNHNHDLRVQLFLSEYEKKELKELPID